MVFDWIDSFEVKFELVCMFEIGYFFYCWLMDLCGVVKVVVWCWLLFECV